jgi:hypothetical protein
MWIQHGLIGSETLSKYCILQLAISCRKTVNRLVWLLYFTRSCRDLDRNKRACYFVSYRPVYTHVTFARHLTPA